VELTVDFEPASPVVALVEPEDCGRFSVVVRGEADDADLQRVLADSSVGGLEGGDALVAVEAVRRLASGAVDDGWEEKFTAMLDYARSRNWLTDGDAFIRAHVEWQ
jgi:hypothetical protein